jgi:hypothetical protein
MSPAGHSNPRALFSWLGIIMYLPLENKTQRDDITKAFKVRMTTCVALGAPKIQRCGLCFGKVFPSLDLFAASSHPEFQMQK